VNERVRFRSFGSENVVELCERCGISRKHGYRWRERHEVGGIDALMDGSRASLHHPQVAPATVLDLIVGARRQHPRWDQGSCW